LFRQKVSGETPCPKDVCHTCHVKKPAVPVKTANPPMGIYTKRDFMRMATAVLMKLRPACVDTRSGHKQLLDNSGLVPEYIKKKFFFPFRITTHKEKEKRRAQERYHDCVTQQREQGAMKHLSEEERRKFNTTFLSVSIPKRINYPIFSDYSGHVKFKIKIIFKMFKL
uniref:Uncharacterized protein n=1 Tax=Cyclopterus lumpus TaxID=8103 RepID=A0A8C3AUK3_CYCLU